MVRSIVFFGLLAGFFIAPPCFLFAQSEPDIHLNSIRHSPYKKKTDTGIQGDSAFLEFVIQKVLDGPQDLIFVANRDLLTPLCIKHCGRTEVIIHDTLKIRKQPVVDIRLKTLPFDSVSHTYTWFEGEDSLIETIDGLPAYGAVFGKPGRMIDSLSVTVGGKKLQVPREAFAGLYDPNLCDNDFFHQPIMAYPSLNGDFLYLYIFGGKDANTYFAKLIFDQKRYLKKIVAEYDDLIRYDALRWDFIGY
ncbi:MAG: hypothetical protein SF052_11750 [Bacteroidia bacterium]|nr:hypothetical protein [Bacteroidia bacterium]